MKYYTWKDIERKLYICRSIWIKEIVNVEVYVSEVVVQLSDMDKKDDARKCLSKILETHLEVDRIELDLANKYMNIIYEQSECGEKKDVVIPLFNKNIYRESAYALDMLDEKLPGMPVIAFHSYKGGVGRTLSLLAFAKAWSAEQEKKKLLIIDSDIEAPGLTWLTDTADEESFSYLDLLEVIQGENDVEKIVDLVEKQVANTVMSIDTSLMSVEHIILPTYRYKEQLLDIYSSPESIAESYDKKFILAEVLSMLAERLGAAAVLVDLRAGISEFSAPLLFDPRVKKYIVTSTSYQSVEGTRLLLEQINKGLPVSNSINLPEIFITMGMDGFDISEISSKLIAEYNIDNFPGLNEEEERYSLTDNLITELPFASELVHLASLEQIMRVLEGRDFYKNIRQVVRTNYCNEQASIVNENIDRESAIQKIHIFASNQISAEGNADFNVLMTGAIKCLIKKFYDKVPSTVVMGAKGAGKTFLFRELLRQVYWEVFINNINNESVKEKKTIMVPMIAPINVIELTDVLKNTVHCFNAEVSFGKMLGWCWEENAEQIKEHLKINHDEKEWREFWKEIVTKNFVGELDLCEIDEKLELENRRVVFLVDGLEEIFRETLSNQNEKNAVLGLVQGFINELRTRYKNIGCIVFLRKDLARNAITVNFSQFESLYSGVELNWSKTEALRLVLWLVNQAIPKFYKGDADIEQVVPDVIEENLTKLWGVKLGKNESNEAYASRWILAALSDFNGQLQARDIIRFLKYATKDVGKKVYDDRYIMPNEIKKAVPECSREKIDEVKQEIRDLSPIFKRLADAPPEKRVLPFNSNTFQLSTTEETLLKQEGYLRVDNEKYYLPEIIRHALGFKYERGARPKVLSLLFDK